MFNNMSIIKKLDFPLVTFSFQFEAAPNSGKNS